MASYNELNALIDAYINRNGVQAITGQILNGVLKAMVEQLGRGYTIMGAAIPTTDPGTPDGPECYFASTVGTYTDFDGLQVAPGELALLCYTPTDGWTKETIYEGFQEVQATIDGNVGTPSVGVSYADGVLSFDFHNMKGNPGQNGQDGAAAGFGTIGADITGGVGTPGVTVESSGPATAKNLQFHFTNLKGETGVTSVVATVDNTTGTPACTVSLVGQQLTLAFSGLKGAQGDTGSSVDYPFTIVNNLTTDDATQALSAAQGVVLAGQVSQLEAKVGEFQMTESLSSYTKKLLPAIIPKGSVITELSSSVTGNAVFVLDENGQSSEQVRIDDALPYTATFDIYYLKASQTSNVSISVVGSVTKRINDLEGNISALSNNVSSLSQNLNGKVTSGNGYDVDKAQDKGTSSRNILSAFTNNLECLWEVGSISGEGAEILSTTRLRSAFAVIPDGCVFSVKSGYKIRIYKYNDDATYSETIDWQEGEVKYDGEKTLCRFLLSKNDDSTIDLTDLSNLNIHPSTALNEIKIRLDDVEDKTGIIKRVDNLANPTGITSGKYLTAAGSEITDANSFVTDFIPVSVGDKISVLGGFTHITSYTQANPNYPSTARGTDTPGTQFTIPEGTPQLNPITFIRVSGKIATLPAMIYKGDFSAPYTPYGTPNYIVLARNVEGGINGFATVPMLNGLKNTIQRNVHLIENIKDYILDDLDAFLEEVKGEKSDLSIPMMTDIHSGNLEPYEMMAYLAKSGAFDGVFTLGDYIPERFDTKEEAVALLSSVLGAEYSFPYRTRILYALKGNHDNNPTRDVVNITMGSYTDFTPTAGSSTPFSSEGLFKGTIATGGVVYLLGTSTPAVRGTDYDFTIINSDACVYDYDYYNLSELRTKPGKGVANRAYGFLDFDRAKVRVVYLDANDIYVNDVPVVYGGNCLIQNEQMNWFANVALDFTDKKTPSEWGVILLLHSAMMDTESSAFEAILNAFTTGGQVNGTFTRSMVGYSNVITLNKDYSGQGALTFICSVSGHQHLDILRKLSNKYNEVNICCDNQTAGKREGSVTTWYTRTAGTIEEHAIDCLMLNKANRKVYFKRLGIGTDREIEY